MPLPNYVLRRSLPRGIRLEKAPVWTPPANIFTLIRKNHNQYIPRDNKRALDYRTALNLYVSYKVKADRLEKRITYSMMEWLFYKESSVKWREKMELIENGKDYNMGV